MFYTYAKCTNTLARPGLETYGQNRILNPVIWVLIQTAETSLSNSVKYCRKNSKYCLLSA